MDLLKEIFRSKVALAVTVFMSACFVLAVLSALWLIVLVSPVPPQPDCVSQNEAAAEAARRVLLWIL